jgi:hypothetical protein
MATRIDPQTTAAPRALLFDKDDVRERYQVLLYSIPVQADKISSLTCILKPGKEPLAIFAIAAETAQG